MTESRNGRVITFYSYKGGTGRTMALANVAWILAANGKRVLAVDWDLEAPGLHRFFHPFLDQAALAATPGVIDVILDYRREALRDIPRPHDWHRAHARVRPHAVSLNWPFPGGSLDFLSAGRQNKDYSGQLVGIDWDVFYNRFGGGQFFDALRADMHRYYDYVLIDSRTGLSDIADICTVQMPDILVVCFTLSDQSIDGAASVARDITERYDDRGIRVLPVPMRIDEGEKEKADAGRALARAKFAGLPEGLAEDELNAYWGSIEIPYRPFYAYEEILAAFGDTPGLSNSMLAACERLAAVVSGGEATAMPPMDEAERLRYVAAYTRRRPTPPSSVLLAHVPEDRMWADWIEWTLTRAGFRVTPWDVEAQARPEPEPGEAATGRTLAVLSSYFTRSGPAAKVWSQLTTGGPGGTRHQPVPVRVDDLRSGLPFSQRGQINLVRLDEAAAAAALLHGLGHDGPAPAGNGAADAPRFPVGEPEISNLPPRYPLFTGRSAELDRLRDRLGRPGAAPPQTLHGLGGVGKTQVALEYAHRFKADYDLVWWIEAEQRDMIRPALADLARRLRLRVGGSVAEAAQAALTELRTGTRYRRWLIVFDNAEDVEQAAEFFPGGPGHTVVTSRNKPPMTLAGALEVDVFTRPESVEHLCRRVDGMSRRDADRVARAVGDLPLAVEVAAAWLAETATPVDTYLRQLEEPVKVLSATRASGYRDEVRATWDISIARLREESRAAVRLLELCSFFGAEPISMALIESESMIQALLPFEPDLRDRYMLGKVVQAVSRFSLAKTDPANNSIQVHRLVQDAVRSALSDDEREATAHEVHRILAEARPAGGGVENPDEWPQFELIWPHLVPSGADKCDEEKPRQLLVDRVRYLWLRGELETARVLGEGLRTAWTRRLGENDLQTLNLCFELGNVLRAQGRYREARELDEETLDRQTKALRPGHPSTLITGGSLAGDLRSLGEFREALERDRSIYRGLREIFGDLHPRVLSVAHNLGIDHRLTGDHEAARRIDEDTLLRRQQVLGPRHPQTLQTKGHLARDLRDAGDYDGSIVMLQEALDDYQEVMDVEVLDTLRLAQSLAVSLRRAGRRADAVRLTEETHQRWVERYGEDAPDTLSCRLSLAADRAAEGDPAGAVRLARDALAGYERRLGDDHPFTWIARNNLAVYLSAAGDAREAAGLAAATLEALERRLGADHPYTLCCMVNLALVHDDLDDPDRAEELLRTALSGLEERYGPEHPDVLACRINLAQVLRRVGKSVQARRLRGQLVADCARVMGESHPLTVAAREWHRVPRELEPQPV